MAKHILDASWSKLVVDTSYKAKSAVRKVVLVNPKYASKMCSKYGMLIDKNLSERVRDLKKLLEATKQINALFLKKTLIKYSLQKIYLIFV